METEIQGTAQKHKIIKEQSLDNLISLIPRLNRS